MATKEQLGLISNVARPYVLEMIRLGEAPPELMWRMAEAAAKAYEDSNQTEKYAQPETASYRRP